MDCLFLVCTELGNDIITVHDLFWRVYTCSPSSDVLRMYRSAGAEWIHKGQCEMN